MTTAHYEGRWTFHKTSWTCQSCLKKNSPRNDNTPVRSLHQLPTQRNASTPRAIKTATEATSATKTAADEAAAAHSPATSPTPAPRTLLASKPPAYRVPLASTMLPASTVSPALSASPAPTSSLVQPTLSESCESLSLEDVVLGEAAADGPAAVAGDTQRELLQETITYNRFSALLDAKLDSKFATIRTCLLAEIKNMIATEIKNATIHIKTETDKLSTQQKKTEENIKTLNEKIEHIENERERLQRQVQELYNAKNEELSSVKNDYITKCREKENSKKIVVHGIRDSYNENKYMLEETVSRAMYDIMNINIHGHIEDIRRIGKRGQCRPIEIELISKRMITYILEHAEQFKNAGLSVTPFLDEETLKERKRLSKLLRSARENNHHAVIRNNKLFIDGKEYNGQQEPANDPNEQSRYDTQEQATPTTSSAQITQRRPNNAPTHLSDIIQLNGYEFCASFNRASREGGGAAVLLPRGTPHRARPDIAELSAEGPEPGGGGGGGGGLACTPARPRAAAPARCYIFTPLHVPTPSHRN
ncbi:hypothetical protein JYU34_012045 [Plutella xylostella]|uniref:Uncharacterized protein n=1 Tax=Plutella xylostella TaxID=51655 RepID=A0ABQ7QEC2_PLUXY|nr:hypothetical protein JYU34_012045 [Plutella xylostella]